MPLKIVSFFDKNGGLDKMTTYQITSRDYITAQKALENDIDAFLLNGLISLASAVNSLNKSNFSWAFIQSYYSIFYLARAFNGINSYVIVYRKSKPYGIKIQPSEKFTKLKGNSHDVVLNQFKTHFSHDILLNNSIEELSPIDWFNQKRNLINYSLNPLTDPLPPIPLFNHNNNLRRWFTTYVNDIDHTYTFDPKHCFISYPIQLFNRIFTHYTENKLTNIYIDKEKIMFFKKNFSDNKGPITTFMTRINELQS